MIKGKTINAEVADNFIKRIKGLMFRKGLKENEGMLFIFRRPGYYSFWMLNMKFPIDIIWISEDKKIVDFVTAYPLKNEFKIFRPKEKALYVLEVNKGFVKKNNIRVGDKVEIEYL